mmetsp:Transcript_85053/g.141781  ORF Transcript_85053/g.141781 Transcript_85053/m.141781 type:complete len:389 (-) Transcript_85053:208-1374(-)
MEMDGTGNDDQDMEDAPQPLLPTFTEPPQHMHTVYTEASLYGLAHKGHSCPSTVLGSEVANQYQPPEGLKTPDTPEVVDEEETGLALETTYMLQSDYAAAITEVEQEEEKERRSKMIVYNAVKLLREYQLGPALSYLNQEDASGDEWSQVLREIRSMEIPTGKLRVALGLRSDEFTIEPTMTALVQRTCSCQGRNNCILCHGKDIPTDGVVLMNAIISKLKVAYDDWKTNIFGAIVAEKQQSQLQQQRQLQTAAAQAPASPPKPAPVSHVQQAAGLLQPTQQFQHGLPWQHHHQLDPRFQHHGHIARGRPPPPQSQARGPPVRPGVRGGKPQAQAPIQTQAQAQGVLGFTLGAGGAGPKGIQPHGVPEKAQDTKMKGGLEMFLRSRGK